MKHLAIVLLVSCSLVLSAANLMAEPLSMEMNATIEPKAEVPQAETTIEAPQVDVTKYTIGAEDVLDINILQPEAIATTEAVSSDGSVNIPYSGNVKVKGLTIEQAKELIQNKLADGYLKYPVVSISLREGRSQKFFVYGEVMKPGAYLAEANTTALKAISMAGGFTKFGSTSRVKILRHKKDGSGDETIKVDMGAAMGGNSKKDVVIQAGDIVVVSEGIF